MEFDWDFLISAGILLWLGLVIGAKMTHQTIGELLTGMKDFINGTREDALERGEELLYYD